MVATPTAFPASGTFGVTERVTLLCATPGAAIHYTMDGGTPTAASPVFDPYVLPVLEAGEAAGTSHYTIQALAVAAGQEASDVATFNYTIERRAMDRILDKVIHPGLHMLVDYDDTKMYLVIGRDRALLVDAGLGNGDLRGLVEALIGALPLDVVITHAHPDHIAMLAPFQGRCPVYMNHLDLPLLQNFNQQRGLNIDPAQIIDLREGFIFDLGDYRFKVYEVPGHSAGSIVLFDEARGLLLAGDAVGSNRPTIVDSLWMQFPGMAKIDVYLSTLRVFRVKVGGKIKETYGGHNDAPILGEAYLDNLQRAAQRLVDQGEAALTPSLRPTDVWQVVAGDRLTDPNWAAINVAKGACLTAPADKLATLSNLQVSQAALEPGFTPFRFSYTAAAGLADTAIGVTATATSGRCRSLTINGEPVQSGEAALAPLVMGDNTFVVVVTSPDGSAAQTYTLVVTRA